MELWVVITVAAAFLQNVRSLLQKRLTGQLSVNGASYVRFLYALPFAWLYALWLWPDGFTGLTPGFAGYVLTGAVAQMVATACLLASFNAGNFAVGTAFSKTETVQAALFGLVLLGDQLSVWVLIGIAVSLVGVVLLSGSVTLRQILRPDRAMWLGLAAGAGFAVSAVGFRGASLALADGSFLQRAGLTVMVAVSLQTLLMGAFLWLREPGEIQRVLSQWRAAVWVGAVGMVASVGWFTAMTLQNAAVVRAVGQVELLFTAVTSVWLLKESLHRREVLGMLLVVAGIVLLI
ncbi:MAG: DMT family transporter [Pseudomonadota bacterium]